MTPEHLDLHREWKSHPMTELLLKWAANEVNRGQDAWLSGIFVHDKDSENQVLGKAQALEELKEYIRTGAFVEEVIDESDYTRLPGSN